MTSFLFALILVLASNVRAAAPSVDFDRSARTRPIAIEELRKQASGTPDIVAKPLGLSDDSWQTGSFISADGAVIEYKARLCAECGSATVFVGGLTLAESFDTLFAMPGKPKTSQFSVWLRGHPPTDWRYTRQLLEADARDLARFINIAAKESGSTRVNLALHSYANFAFQKLVQLRDDAEVGAALGRLRGAQVLFLNGTTNCKDCRDEAGEGAAQVARSVKLFEDWLDAGDAGAEAMRASARLNPLLAPSVNASLAVWNAQRTAALASSTYLADKAAVKDLDAPWDGADDAIRLRLQGQVKKNVRDSGWQEALMKRSNDTYQFDFTKRDVQAIRRLGIRLDMVHADKDQLVRWPWARLTMDFFGIPAPERLPPPGTVLRDAAGLFSFRVVSGDHYFPLKQPAELDGLLSR